MKIKYILTNLITMQSLRTKLLHHNHKSYGPFLLSASSNTAEVLAGIGYSHLVVDMEHSPADISTITSILRSIDSASRGKAARDNFPIVRAPSGGDVATTKRILDVLRLPGGIMFPMIDNAEQAKLAVSSTRYPPHGIGGTGIRGCAYPFVRASEYGNNREYFSVDSNEELLTIVQVESEQGINNIPEIGMVDGVDVIFLGPFDISASIGEVGNFESNGKAMTLLRQAEISVLETSKRKRKEKGVGLCLGGFRAPGRPLKEMFSDNVGYQFVSGSLDLGLLQAAALADYEVGQDAIE